MKTARTMISGLVAASLAALLALAAPALAQKAAAGRSPILPGGNSKSPISVDAAKLEYFDKEQRLVYSGGVLAKQGESTLKASTMVVFLTKEEGEAQGGATDQGRIRRIEAAGPVTVTQVDQVGTGDRGIYDKGENKVYLIGNVVLSQGPNVTKGDRDSKLVYDLDSGHAQVLGGRVNSIFTPNSSDDRGRRPAR